MAGRKIFGFDLRAAAGTVELDDADPERVGGKIECAGDEGRMNFARVAIVDQAAFFVIFAGGAQGAVAAVAGPLFGVEVQVEIFGDAQAVSRLCWRLLGWRSLLLDCLAAELPNRRGGLRRSCCPR